MVIQPLSSPQFGLGPRSSAKATAYQQSVLGAFALDITQHPGADDIADGGWRLENPNRPRTQRQKSCLRAIFGPFKLHRVLKQRKKLEANRRQSF